MARTAVDGAVAGAGGLPPVSRTTAPITTTRQASQPRMKARPFLVPFSRAQDQQERDERERLKGDAQADQEQVKYHLARLSSSTPPLH